jgi:hypothetical protein
MAHKTLLTVFFLVAGHIIASAQWIVSGTVQTVPSRTTPTEAKITLTNTSNGNKYAQRTRDGTFTLNVPNGTYEEKVEVQGNYLLQGNVSITGNKTINEKIIEDKPLTSELYLGWNRSLLFLFKSLTATTDGSPRGTLLSRARDSPLKIFARNYDPEDPISMPQGIRPYLDTILADINVKTDAILQFVETGTDPVRVQFQYPTSAEMPMSGVFGWTMFNYDLTNIWIDRQFLLYYMNNNQHNKNNGIFARELYRATAMFTNSADPAMVSYTSGPTAARFHPDESEVIKRVFTLDNGTDMFRHKDVVVTSIPNVLPQLITFSAPANNSTITYVDDNLVINYTSINPRDGDGEAQRVVVRLRGNGLDQYITDANTDGIILVPKTTFEPLKQYTLEGMTISGFDTLSAANTITFNTPEDIPTTISEPGSNGIKIYPNPVKSILTIENLHSLSGLVTIEITGSNGQIMKKLRFEEDYQNSILINFSDFDPGLYFIILKSKTYSGSFKVTKI